MSEDQKNILDNLTAERDYLKKRLQRLEDKYKNLDLDLIHERSQLLSTQVEALTREKQDLTASLTTLVKEITTLTTIYVRIRRVREAEWDLPEEQATQVDGKSWKKLMEMERKAFKMIESICGFVEKVPQPPPPPVKAEPPKPVV